ncbi:MAG: adenine-specific methyltransferase EcoRI family protein [Muribaculaceae bacterium]|nr:adenine-specific methyltransferase EcoRI family protein [Muribaculaceae bacterium]
MARQSGKIVLQNAKKSKCDEFYTQLCDIERELQHYTGCFRDKVVYCNCDDPHHSNFYRYFKENFKTLGLRKLIASCYNPQLGDMFHMSDATVAYYSEYTGEDNPEIATPFNGNGDFRSNECLALLQQSDIVVTNPPFSLFREFVSQIVRHKKQFLIIGNVNAITYKEIFSLIQNNQAWLGVNLGRGISGFIVPSHYNLYGSEVRINEDGQRIVATNGCLWLTNLEFDQRHQDLNLTKQYVGNEAAYPKYENCNGINIDRTQDIPKDYTGLMGVPITFLHKYNPEQFEIVRFRKGDDGKDLRLPNKSLYFRILIRNKRAGLF